MKFCLPSIFILSLTTFLTGFRVPALAKTLHVNNLADNASDNNPGTLEKPFKTVQRGVDLAYAGDTVLVYEGIYRESVHPVRSGKNASQMIHIKGKENQRVVISGAEKWTVQFEKIALKGTDQVVWKGELISELFQSPYPIPAYNPFHTKATPVFNLGYTKGGSMAERYKKARPITSDEKMRQTLGMVIYQKTPLRQCFDTKDMIRSSGNYFVTADGQAIIFRLPGDADPQPNDMQLAVREQVLAPRISGLRFIHLQGLTFEYAANGIPYPVNGMVSTSSGQYWIIEDCTIQYANTIGLDFGMGHWIPRIDKPWPQSIPENEQYDADATMPFDCIVRNNQILNNGTNGIFSYMGVSFKRTGHHLKYPFASALIEGNDIQYNNWQGMYRWKEAGIKLLAGKNILIRGNNVSNNNAMGIWIDVCYGNVRMTQNLIANNVMTGIFCEGTPGPTLIDNNIIMNTVNHYTNAPKADGIYQHQCPNITVAHNLLANNSNSGVKMILHSKGALGTFHKANASVSYNHILNNIIQGNGSFAAGLPMKTPLSKGNLFQGNLSWGSESIPLYELARATVKPDDLIQEMSSLLNRNSDFALPVFWNLWQNKTYGYRYPGATLIGPRVRLDAFETYFDSKDKNWDKPLQMYALGNDGWLKLNVNKDNYRHNKMTTLKYAKLADYKVRPISNMQYDYFGNKRQSDKTIPGPFANPSQIGAGETHWVDILLWPNKQVLRTPAAEMQLNETLPPENLKLPLAPWN